MRRQVDSRWPAAGMSLVRAASLLASGCLRIPASSETAPCKEISRRCFKSRPPATSRHYCGYATSTNVAIRGLRFEGGSYESGCARHLDYGHAIYVQSDAGESRGVDGVEISGNTFHDFNGQSWITVNAADGSPGVGLNSAVAIRNNVFDSDADLRGGCAGSGGISYPVMMGMAARFGRFRAGSGRQRSGRDPNTFSAAYVKGAVVSWSGTRTIGVEQDLIRDAGLRLPRPRARNWDAMPFWCIKARTERPGLPPDSVRVAYQRDYQCGLLRHLRGGRQEHRDHRKSHLRTVRSLGCDAA